MESENEKTASVNNNETKMLMSFKRHISTIFGLIIDPRNIQLSVGPIVVLMKHCIAS